ncbi:hypothetical protein BH09SUM1_BH09SUM1_05770 [soil metagenome]
MAAAFPAFAIPATSAAGSAPPASQSEGVRSRFVRSDRQAVVYYDEALTVDQVLGRAEADSKRLGLPLTKTMGAAHAAILQGSPELVRAKVAASENIPIVEVSDVYLYGGDIHPDSMFVFTNRVIVHFREGLGEIRRQEILNSAGLERVRELPTGAVIVRTAEKRSIGMVGFAQDLSCRFPEIEKASFDFAMSGHPTQAGGDSLQVNDTLFPLQWPLFNEGINANNGLGLYDEDMDAPRAWMLNRRNGKSPYGSPSIVVAIFDSGTETAHEDLAQNIDTRVGFDTVDGGAPTPASTAQGAHGTAMAGTVAAAQNGKGIVGVAPGIKIYTSRIFANDYTTTNARIVAALNDSVSRNIDVNLHPYTLPLACGVDSLTTSDIDTAFRLTFESGRTGRGISNIAASGNFFSQVEYPASSRYAVAVGSVASEGAIITQSNWGGVGVDVVMPSYRINLNAQQDQTFGSGLVATDLTGSNGVLGPSTGLNSSGNYAAFGTFSSFPQTTPAIASAFLGTSFSSAMVAGTVALMLGDERYVDLRPLVDKGNRSDRESRRARGPQRTNSPAATAPTTILGELNRYDDLPTGPLAYVDQYNERLGHGLPNPARALLADSGQPARESVLTSLLGDPFYEVHFGVPDDTDNPPPVIGEGPRNANFGATRNDLAQGWRASDDLDGDGYQTPADPDAGTAGESTAASLSSDFGDANRVYTSPYLEPVRHLYFENPGDDLVPSSGSNFLYVWTDSVTTSSYSEQPTVADNIDYNPKGAYYHGKAFSLTSPPTTISDTFITGIPMVMEIDLGHELGAENASSSENVVRQELDPLTIDMVVKIETAPGKFSQVPLNVATITGDSATSGKRHLCGTNFVTLTTAPSIGDFPSWPVTYDPLLPDDAIVIRKYKFVTPPVPAGTVEVTFRIKLSPGPSYLPTRHTVNGAQVQLYNVFRDHKGFIFQGMKVTQMEPGAFARITATRVALNGGGYQPTWTRSMNDVMMFEDRFVGNWLTALPTTPTYIDGTGAAASTAYYDQMRLLATNEKITGLKSHPNRETLAITTNDGANGYVYTATDDGINMKPLSTAAGDAINLTGAREPGWTSQGNLLIATPTSIHQLLISPSGTVTDETIITTANSLFTDFRTPVADESGGLIYFAARRKDVAAPDNHLNIYLATRGGRIVNFQRIPNGPLFEGWDGVDLYDLDISASGKRLVFVSNASNAPSSGTIIAMGNTSIFTVENADYVVTYGDDPIYSVVPYNLTLPFATVSARYPRISPDDAGSRLVYMAYTAPASPDTITGQNLVLENLDRESTDPPVASTDPLPTPSSTPPPGTPPPFDNANVTKTGEYTFDLNQEGWVFVTAAPALVAPAGTYITAALQGDGDGKLQLTSNNNNQKTFGFWESPGTAIQIQPNSLYLYRATVRSTGSSSLQQPSIRLRANSKNFESSFLAETGSRGDRSLSPTNAGRQLDLLFKPMSEVSKFSLDNQAYLTSFDLKNVDTDDDPNGGFALEKVELFRLDEAGKYYAFYCFEVPAGGASVTLTATGSNTSTGNLSIQLRNSVMQTGGGFGCVASTTAAAGASMTGDLLPGLYSVIISSLSPQDITLAWTSNVPLIANCPPCGTGKLFQYASLTAACGSSTAISGTSGSTTKAPFYDGEGIVPASTCDPVETNTVVKGTETVFEQKLNTSGARSIWSTGGAPGVFDLPEFLTTNNSLALRQLHPSNTFGFYTLDGNDVPAGNIAPDPGQNFAIFRATFRLANEFEPTTKNLPAIRFRLSTGDFQRTVEAQLEGGSLGILLPAPNSPRDVQAYMVLENVPTSFNTFVVGFDILSFYPSTRTVSNTPIELREFRLERVHIPNYPALP